MEKARQLVGLLHLYDVSKQANHKVDLNDRHLEEIGFSQGEIAYLLELFKEKGWLHEGGVFSTYYYFNDKGKHLAESLISHM